MGEVTLFARCHYCLRSLGETSANACVDCTRRYENPSDYWWLDRPWLRKHVELVHRIISPAPPGDPPPSLEGK